VFKKSIDSVQTIDELSQDEKDSLCFSGAEAEGRFRSKIQFAKEELERNFDISKPSQDWESWLQAIERDILETLSNNHLKVVKDRIKERRPSLYQIYTGRGPWTEIAREIRATLMSTQQLQEDNEKLKNKAKENSASMLLLKKDLDKQQ
jgi:hypothetical protein